jgi:anaerobic magnesium-protoporphyrin IX monomethyl ester cyclase
MSNGSILLVSFYNQKAIGVRYLERALISSGYKVDIVFFKGFNSVKPAIPTKMELEMLKGVIDKVNPSIIGLSVMSSLYIEAVHMVNSYIRNNFSQKIVWGGVYPTLFPEKCLEYSDFVIRGEGETAFIELIDALSNNKDYESISNVAYIKNGIPIINEVRNLCQDLDEYGYPIIGGDNKYFINNDMIINGDPQLKSLSYETTASRGCPFACSYCSSINLHRVYNGKGRYVRFRSVESVMDELNDAKKNIKNLKVIHFWDEIFSDDINWIEKFTERYKKEIDLPFEIWGHPLKVDKVIIRKLVDAGLYKVVMGIQSGSVRIRKDIFHRVEKQDDIINASKTLKECKVPQVIYDFMLQHPFETNEDIRETYELCLKLERPFELQLHGLNFLPGTDITDMAVNMNIMNGEELESIMSGSIQVQYDMYWKHKNNNSISNYWYSLIYLTQFGLTRPAAKFIGKRLPIKQSIGQLAVKMHTITKPLSKIRYLYNKGRLVIYSRKSC